MKGINPESVKSVNQNQIIRKIILKLACRKDPGPGLLVDDILLVHAKRGWLHIVPGKLNQVRRVKSFLVTTFSCSTAKTGSGQDGANCPSSW